MQPHDVTHITVSAVRPSPWTSTLWPRSTVARDVCLQANQLTAWPVCKVLEAVHGVSVQLLEDYTAVSCVPLVPCYSFTGLESAAMIGSSRLQRPCCRLQRSPASVFRRQAITASRRPAVRVLSFANDSTLKIASQPYIRKFAVPLNKAALSMVSCQQMLLLAALQLGDHLVKAVTFLLVVQNVRFMRSLQFTMSKQITTTPACLSSSWLGKYVDSAHTSVFVPRHRLCHDTHPHNSTSSMKTSSTSCC